MKRSVARTLAFAPELVFEVISDVAAYPQFIPWIQSLRTWNQSCPAEGCARFDAEVRVGFAMFRERFSTRVETDRARGDVAMQLLSGPLSHLDGRWRVSPAEGGSRIDIEIDYRFKNSLLQRFSEVNIDYAIQRLVRCFEDRARSLSKPVAGTTPVSSHTP